ncbi:polyprenyl synthetase family protein [Catenisphaera adipataccumulans]|jgi:geranylgeranyl diphosphate synthase type II|uniref:Farnesyl diphosphate synthase n=1 Tax=Catenisphaera adipataccumulans TaxID=700500 RepID=A0A7W8D189_9FIRM|nr:farnesyl diphosphate synthase [Catenisphaera adipataccumulans]MBB5183695.1 geranylgeranyl diphosphate synthase type II [Catenisphaera adipataccumulans]
MILKNEFEAYLKAKMDENIQGRVNAAMSYSLFAGGKRVRPQLLFAALQDYGADPAVGLPAAAALEMIQTYSLIHDDLPAMDDDDLRRGKPSCHVAFDEATAILAGDGLLTLAFRVLCESPKEKVPELVAAFSDHAGANGMVYGQELDLKAEADPQPTIEKLYTIDQYKTAKLLTLPLLSAAILTDHREDQETMKTIGYDIGIQFQVLDDILDVTQSSEALGKSTSDAENNKMTAVSLLGLEKAKQTVADLEQEINTAIDSLHSDGRALKEWIAFLTNRTY